MSARDDFPDAEAVVQWFLTDKHGQVKAQPTHDEGDLRKLVDTMLARPDPFGWKDAERPSPARAWNWALDFGLLYIGGKQGWIDREGKFWTCGWAKHDNLLYWLGMEPEDAEKAGWVRVTQGLRYRSRYRLSPRQRRALKRLGVEADKDAERLLPVWVEDDTRDISTENLGSDPAG